MCISSSSPGLGFSELKVKLKIVSRPGLQVTEKRPGEEGRMKEQDISWTLTGRKSPPESYNANYTVHVIIAEGPGPLLPLKLLSF